MYGNRNEIYFHRIMTWGELDRPLILFGGKRKMFSDRHIYYDVLIMILKLMKVPAELDCQWDRSEQFINATIFFSFCIHFTR